MKYYVEITGLGPDSLLFLDDENTNFIIIFNNNAPEELAEMSVLHTEGTLLSPLSVGDVVLICDRPYTISAIGSEAEHTLKELGHCTLSFKGGDEPERPGCIMLEGEPMCAEYIKVGGTIEIF